MAHYATFIGSYDAHDHDVLPEAEFVGSLSALIASGLVDAVADRFRLTSEGKRIAKAARGGMFEIARSVLPDLSAVPRYPGDFQLPTGQYHEAWLAYHTDMQRWM